MSHALSNGRGALHWVVCWVAAANGESVPVSETAGRFIRPPRESDWLCCRSISWVFRTGGSEPRPRNSRLDPWQAPIPLEAATRPGLIGFSEPDTNRILAEARALDLSLTQYLCVSAAEAMLSAQPEKSRVCIAVPY